MGAFIAKQPNGLLCRFSTIVDCITDYNMTESDYIQLCMEKAAQDAKDTLKKHIRPFSEVKKRFIPNNMTEEEFEKITQEMSIPFEQNEVKGITDSELIKAARKAANAWRNDAAYYQAAQIIDMLIEEIKRLERK